MRGWGDSGMTLKAWDRRGCDLSVGTQIMMRNGLGGFPHAGSFLS